MKNLTTAQRKRERRKFRVGDVVTWGQACVSHKVVEVTDKGVMVDVTSQDRPGKLIDIWATKRPDGRYVLLVLFDGNLRSQDMQGVTRGPVWHTNMPPDGATQ